MRPILTQKISIESFQDFYWLKEELQSFCKENGMSAADSKNQGKSREGAIEAWNIIKKLPGSIKYNPNN